MSKQFAKFRVGELVTMETHSLHNSGDVSGKGDTPYITRSTLNNGLAKFARENEIKDLVSGNAITVAGESSKLFYQPVNFIVGTKVAVLRYPQINQYNAQYMITCIEKATMSQYGFSNILTGNRVVEAVIQLPVTDTNTPNPEPDWEYMENYIKTIERKFIDQIAEHNSKEQEILEQLHPESVNTKPEAHGFEEIRVGDLFEITPTKKPRISGVSGYVDDEELLSRPGRNPYIVATASNNGIKCWTSVEPENKSDAITISTTADSSNTIFYQPVPFVGRQQIAQIRKKGNAPLTKRIAFYVMTLLRKHTLYSNYGNKLTKEELGDFKLHLPVTPAGEIDWYYMEQYITWIETRERERVESYVQYVKNRS
mgnify:CR=1 FL=1